jgi:hypothetical protein
MTLNIEPGVVLWNPKVKGIVSLMVIVIFFLRYNNKQQVYNNSNHRLG